MPEVKLEDRYKVVMIESERGWGQKIDEVIYFDNEAEAKKYVEDYNKEYNNQKFVPDWYIVAEYRGKVS